jgi:hypothetical protein
LALFGLGAMPDWIPQCTAKRDIDKMRKAGPAIGEHTTAACSKRVKLNRARPVTSAGGES